jgi:hypothetical protein
MGTLVPRFIRRDLDGIGVGGAFVYSVQTADYTGNLAVIWEPDFREGGLSDFDGGGVGIIPGWQFSFRLKQQLVHSFLRREHDISVFTSWY